MSGVISPQGILLCYGPTLFEARRNKFDPSKEPRYEANLILDKAAQATQEYKELRAAIMAALEEKFGPAKLKGMMSRLKMPIKPYDKGNEGDLVMKAWSKQQPQVVNGSLQTVTVSGDVWSGQKARFEVNPWVFDTAGAVGVTLFLNNVQITKRDMPRLDGRKSADKVFGVVEDEAGEESMAGSGTEDGDDLPF